MIVRKTDKAVVTALLASTAAILALFGVHRHVMAGTAGAGDFEPESAHKVTWIWRSRTAHVGVAIGEEYLQPDRLERIFRTLRKPDLPPRHAILVTAYPNPETGTWMNDGQSFEGMSFDDWRETLLRVRRQYPWRAARIISTIDGTVLQVADNGTYTARVLSGVDPTRFPSNGVRFSLLEASFIRLPISGKIVLRAYLKADQAPTPKP